MNLANALKILFITIGIGCLVLSYQLFTAADPASMPFPMTEFRARFLGICLLAAAVFLILANRKFE
jgi:hypothetical protein